MSYTPTNIPELNDLHDVRRYLDDELRKLAVQTGEATEVSLIPLARAPEKPREGMVVYADGTNWDPGEGAGPYSYTGGVWEALINDVVDPGDPETFPVDDTLRDDGKYLVWDEADETHKYYYASPKATHLDLRDFMDAQYGVGGWTNWSGVGTGSDCTAALEAACQAFKDSGRVGPIFIPGRYRLASTPDPAKLAGNTLVGPEGPLFDDFIYTGTSGFALNFNGAAGFSGGGIDGVGLFCRPESGPFNTATYGLALTVSAGPDSSFQYAASFSSYKNMYIQGLDGYSFAFNIYCPLQTKVVDAPHGIAQGGRVISFENIQCFAGWSGAYYFSNLVDLRISGLTSSGAAPVSDVYFTGGGTPGVDGCDGLHLEGLICNGDLYLHNLQNFTIFGQCGRVDLGVNLIRGAGLLRAGTTTGAGPGAGTANFIIY